MSINNNNDEITTRILQELITIRTEMTQMNRRVGNLEQQFRHQFAPVVMDNASREHNEANASPHLVVDAEARARMIVAPNRRGPREIGKNPTKVAGASYRQRYDAMLQTLHQRKFGVNSPPLLPAHLKSCRLKMHDVALKLLPSLNVIAPNITKWTRLDNDDKMFFSLLLEDKIFAVHGFEIFRCAGQWCADGLLSEAYRAYRGQLSPAKAVRLGE